MTLSILAEEREYLIRVSLGPCAQARACRPISGGGSEGELLVGIMMFVVLIPFFGFTELSQAIGKEQFDALILRHKAER